MINTPANPSGKVFTRTELEWIAEFANKHDLFVFTDEIYEYFCSTLTKVGLTPSIPQGAYYVLADVSRLPGRTSKDKKLQKKWKFVVVETRGRQQGIFLQIQ